MKNFKHTLITIFACVLFFSCTNQFESMTKNLVQENFSFQSNSNSEVIKLGNQIENPFISSSRQISNKEANYVYFKIRTNRNNT